MTRHQEEGWPGILSDSLLDYPERAAMGSDLLNVPYATQLGYCELLTGRLPYSKEEAEVVVAEKLVGRLNLSRLPRRERHVHPTPPGARARP